MAGFDQNPDDAVKFLYNFATGPSVPQGAPPFSQTMSLGGIIFHINPDSIQMTTERVFTDMPTRTGYVRFTYGVKPYIYTLDGMTGNAGIAHLRDMDHFRPMFGNRDDKVYHFIFPALFGNQVKGVRINKFSDSMRSDTHLYNFYSMELEEYVEDAHNQTYVKGTVTAPASVLPINPRTPSRLS